MHFKKLPEEKVLVQELLITNVSQWKHRVDSQEKSTVDGYQLQTLHTWHPARQHLWVRLPQPISVCLESKKWAFREIDG